MLLSNFLAYAMLNQPTVEASYYDRLASIERITSARSQPDPQLTFQMDIQNIVTSVMPGLLVNFPGPGKLRAGAEVAAAERRRRRHHETDCHAHDRGRGDFDHHGIGGVSGHILCVAVATVEGLLRGRKHHLSARLARASLGSPSGIVC